MASTSTLNFHITGDSTGLQAAAQRASSSIRTMQSNVQRSTTQLQGFNATGRKTGMMLLEASRGVEDFMVSFTTGGIAGGLRGAGNNISQLATMIHPLAGAIAGVGVGLGAVLIPKLFQTSDTAKTLATDIDRLRESVEHFFNVTETRRATITTIADLSGLDQANAKLKETQAEHDKTADRIDHLKQRLATTTNAESVIRERSEAEFDKFRQNSPLYFGLLSEKGHEQDLRAELEANRLAQEELRSQLRKEESKLGELKTDMELTEQARERLKAAEDHAKLVEDLKRQGDAAGEELAAFSKRRAAAKEEQDRLESEARKNIKDTTEKLTALDARRRPESVSAPSAALGGSADAASIINRTVARAIDPNKDTAAKQASRERQALLRQLQEQTGELRKLREERKQSVRIGL